MPKNSQPELASKEMERNLAGWNPLVCTRNMEMRHEIFSVLDHIGVATKTDVDKLLETCMAKIQEKKRNEVFKTVKATSVEAMEHDHLASYDELNAFLFKILENTLTEVS